MNNTEVAGPGRRTGTLCTEPGSPWENGYCESFNGKLRDECLNGEIFYSLKEAQVVIEQWRVEYNTRRPHSALGYRPPAPAAFAPRIGGSPWPRLPAIRSSSTPSVRGCAIELFSHTVVQKLHQVTRRNSQIGMGAGGFSQRVNQSPCWPNEERRGEEDSDHSATRALLIKQCAKRHPDCPYVCFRLDRRGHAVKIESFQKVWRSRCVRSGLGKMEPVLDSVTGQTL